MADYYTLLTDAGIAYETACKAAGVPIKLAHISVGDGNGAVYNPDASAKALKREVWRGPLNALFQDEKNASWLMAEVTIPSDVGGWYVREAGLWTDTGILYAVVKYPESYKPILATSGSGKEFYIRSIFETSNASIVTLLIDDTVVKATRAWVMDYLKQGTYSKAEIEAMIAKASALPVGVMVPFPLGTVPPGYLEVDNSLFKDEVYPDLAVYLAKKFNLVGDAAGYTRLPETRGEFFRGWDHGRGVDSGRTLASYQADAFKSHTHTPPNQTGINSAQGPVGVKAIGGSNFDALQNVGFAGDTETRPRNLVVMWCIKAWDTPINQGNIDISSLIPFATQATETNQGTAKVGTQDQVNSGLDDTAMLTSKKLRSAKSTCSAWVNWNGTGSVVVRDSYNVSSITDNGIGDFTINLATPMSNPNYSFSYTVGGIGSALNLCSGSAVAPTVSALRVLSVSALGMGAGANFQMTDFPINSVHIFGGK